jgi:hypothetical protein
MATHVVSEEDGRRCRGGTSRRHQEDGDHSLAELAWGPF